MLRTVTTLLLAATLPASPSLQAQSPAAVRWSDSISKLIASGVEPGQPAAMDPALALIDRVLTIVPNDALMLHYKGLALYRKASPMMEDALKKAEVKALLEEAENAFAISAKTLAWPETHALRASVTGQMIAVGNPISGMWLGPRADGQMDKALELGPNNPRVWMLKGIGTMFKPKIFGGGADRAEKELLKALELFTNDRPAPPAPAWGHAEAYTWLGRAYAAQDKLDEARAAYEKALQLDPGNGWVIHVLLPALDRKSR
ncbi:MAG: tetratricopeptide repeat protein [Gemmatimonadaceae bacterium]